MKRKEEEEERISGTCGATSKASFCGTEVLEREGKGQQ